MKRLFTAAQSSVEYGRNPAPSDHWKAFAREIDDLGRELKSSASLKDFRHLRHMERFGRLATFLGYATAWMLPNPVSAFLISLGNFARWALVFHPISHGALDRIKGVPHRYTSDGFAQGKRRFLDWFDWILPEAWAVEHNHLHHYFLGTEKDPDVVARNARYIRELKAPLFVRTALAFLMISIWKPFYYAPNTLAELRHQKGESESNLIGAANWNPLKPAGFQLWAKCLLPYALARFVLIPAFFFPLGAKAVMAVFLNSLLAEIFTNLHSFIAIGPNHTGDDIPTFSTPARGRAEHYLRQIVGTVNFPSSGNVADFFYGGLNYQIEHHLWPEASLLQCQQASPRLKEICARYGVPYKEEPIFKRVWITIRTVAGDCPSVELPSGRIL